MIKIANVTRLSMLGDCIASLPFAVYLEKCFPDSIKIALLDKKCVQLAPLLINIPYIDGIRITEKPDQITQNDEDYFKKFDLVFEPFPTITEENYYNKRSVIEETFKMNWLRGKGRINPAEWDKLSKEERSPRLTQYFNAEKNDNYIAIWGNSGYVTDLANQKRNPTKEYWADLVLRLIKKGYKVAQLGTSDHDLISEKTLDLRRYSLFDAVKFSLGSLVSIGVDSGSQHVIAAYGHPQIILSTYWRSGHIQCPESLVPVNWKNRAINLFHPTNINSIGYDQIIEGIKILHE